MKKKHKKQYWKAVRRILEEKYDLRKKIAKRGIKKYRKVLKKDKVGLIIYHSSVEDTADGIVSGEYIFA
jgi:hypothetical protein